MAFSDDDIKNSITYKNLEEELIHEYLPAENDFAWCILMIENSYEYQNNIKNLLRNILQIEEEKLNDFTQRVNIRLVAVGRPMKTSEEILRLAKINLLDNMRVMVGKYLPRCDIS